MRFPEYFIALLLAIGSCRIPPPPPVIPPVDPTVYAKDCSILYQDELGRVPDSSGLRACETRLAMRGPTGLVVETQEQFRAWIRTTPEWKQHQDDIRVVVLPRLAIRNQHFFGLEGGSQFYGIDTSDFNLLGRLVNGEDIGPVRQQRKDLGFNMRRIFTRYDIDPRYGIGRLRLDEHPDLYDKIPVLLQLLAHDGAYVNLVAYTGPYTEGFDPRHWQRVCDAVRNSPNAGSVLLSLVNEVEQPANEMDPWQFQPCPGVLSSRGSYGSRMWPSADHWDWVEYHSNSDPEWWRSTGHECMEISNSYNVPCFTTENPRFDDQDSNVRHACDAGGTSALLNSADTAHSIHGKNSTLFVGRELEQIREWVNCARSVPLFCQDRPYDLLNRGEPNAGARRIYTRGGTPECTRETSRQ